ncbi:MAG: helix-turn-helix domain-containing protein [Desulfatiglans sp.]|jgi:excisionase family DNA binding protein|nr:helix-turn-helix domain-containing protein [Desulfatiglans sp.]
MKTVSSDDFFLDLTQLSARSGLSKRKLREYIQAGAFPAYQPGGKILINWRDFRDWVECSKIEVCHEMDFDRMVEHLLDETKTTFGTRH